MRYRLPTFYLLLLASLLCAADAEASPQAEDPTASVPPAEHNVRPPGKYLVGGTLFRDEALYLVRRNHLFTHLISVI